MSEKRNFVASYTAAADPDNSCWSQSNPISFSWASWQKWQLWRDSSSVLASRPDPIFRGIQIRQLWVVSAGCATRPNSPSSLAGGTWRRLWPGREIRRVPPDIRQLKSELRLSRTCTFAQTLEVYFSNTTNNWLSGNTRTGKGFFNHLFIISSQVAAQKCQFCNTNFFIQSWGFCCLGYVIEFSFEEFVSSTLGVRIHRLGRGKQDI